MSDKRSLKMWEVIKELTENPSKRFQAIFHEGVIWEVCKHENGSIECIYGKGDLAECRGVLGLGKIEMEAKWEEVKEPVTFIEVVKSGKRAIVKHEIICDNTLTKTSYRSLDNIFSTLGDFYYAHQIKEIITNGKWYIED